MANSSRQLFALQFEADSQATVLVLGAEMNYPVAPCEDLRFLAWPISEIPDDTGGWAQSDAIDEIAVAYGAGETEFYTHQAGEWVFSGRCLQGNPSRRPDPSLVPKACGVSANTSFLIESFLTAIGMVSGESKSVTLLNGVA